MPPNPRIYHITHIGNLSKIVEKGNLLPDATILPDGGPPAAIGMTAIKARRLTLPVKCHPGDHVGDYVPFYFCPRSIMLYVISKDNHPDLTYHGGQDPIVHLEADLKATVAWAEENGRRWAFSLSNAGAAYAQFRSSLTSLDQLNWSSIAATDFKQADVKEGKQAEFLLRDSFPWELVTRIGVRTNTIRTDAITAIEGATHQPDVVIEPSWYY